MSEQVKDQALEVKNAMSEVVDSKLETLKKEVVSKDELTSSLKDAIKPLEEVIKAQGESINEFKKTNSVKLMKAPIEGLFDAYKDKLENNKSEKIEIVTKDWDSLNTFTVGSVAAGVYPNNGSNSNIGSGIQTMMSQLIGGYSIAPTNVSSILNYVNAIPLNQGRLAKMSEVVDGTAEVTPEGALKPYMSSTFSLEEVRAEAVATVFKVSTETMRFYPQMANELRVQAGKLVDEKIPNYILSQIYANAPAWTPAAGLQAEANPNAYDVFIRTIATLQANGYNPDSFHMHPVQYANLKGLKNANGDYLMRNGGSIEIIGTPNSTMTMLVDGYPVNLVLDKQLGVDEFLVGDFRNSVYVGIDNMIAYDFFGVTYDASITPNASSDGQRNLKSHVIEKYIAMLMPTVSLPGLIKGTFTTAKATIIAL